MPNANFGNASELLLHPDHYVFRMLYSHGVSLEALGGAQFTQDVHAYETAKLRMLNGAHSALAYLGLARGHEFVHQAIADPELALLIDRLTRRSSITMHWHELALAQALTMGSLPLLAFNQN
jgi:Mannitol dehydrogenase C-terminal domain